MQLRNILNNVASGVSSVDDAETEIRRVFRDDIEALLRTVRFQFTVYRMPDIASALCGSDVDSRIPSIVAFKVYAKRIADSEWRVQGWDFYDEEVDLNQEDVTDDDFDDDVVGGDIAKVRDDGLDFSVSGPARLTKVGLFTKFEDVYVVAKVTTTSTKFMDE